MSDSKTVLSVKPEIVDLLRARHLLGACLMLVSIWGLALIDSSIGMFAVPAWFLTLAALIFPARFARFSKKTWNTLGVIVVTVTLADILLSAGTGRENIIPAVLRAAMCIAVLRTLQPRNRREEQQHLLLAMFLLAAGGTLSLSPLFAVQVLFFIPISCGILFLTNRVEPRSITWDRRELWTGFSYGAFLAELRRKITGRTVGFFVLTLTSVIVCGGCIFMVIPRHRMNNDVPFLAIKGSGKSGFSETVTLGGFAEVLLDPAVAIRADPPGNSRPVANPYWRLVALDLYRSGEADCGFTISESVERGFRRTEDSHEWTNPGLRSQSGDSVTWRVHMEGNISRYPAMPGPVKSVRFDKAERLQFNRIAELLRLSEASASTLHMLAQIVGDGYRMPTEPRETQALARLSANRRSLDYSVYPGTLLSGPSDSASVEALSRIVTEIRGAAAPEGTSDFEAFVSGASAWLAKHHRYALADGYGRTVSRPGEPRDYMVRWLESGATGWCEHFATSFVLLARSAGYPARLVTGFSGGEWNDADSYFVVRMKNAHAWAEVYDGAGAWVRVDPTPGSADSMTEETGESRVAPRSFSGLEAWYDSLTMAWFRKIVNFESEDRAELTRSFSSKVKAALTEAGSYLRAMKASLSASVRDAIQAPGTWIALLATLGGIVAATFVVRHGRRRSLRRRLATASNDDPQVRRIRIVAGNHLRVLRDDRERAHFVTDTICRDLETIRYDTPSRWPDPEATFRTFKMQRRKARRRTR